MLEPYFRTILSSYVIEHLSLILILSNRILFSHFEENLNCNIYFSGSTLFFRSLYLFWNLIVAKHFLIIYYSIFNETFINCSRMSTCRPLKRVCTHWAPASKLCHVPRCLSAPWAMRTQCCHLESCGRTFFDVFHWAI